MALARGVTVCVGPRRKTHARFRLQDPAEVCSFLEKLETEVTMKTAEQAFQFVTASYLTRINNQKASTLVELADGLDQATDASVFYHTFQSLGRYHFLTEGFSNDFAQWVLAALNRPVLAEWLGGVDIRDYVSLAELRADLRRLVADYCKDHPREAEISAFEPFYFCESVEVTVPLGSEAHTLEEFRSELLRLSHSSFYYHFISSRLRLQLKTNDFSLWFDAGLGLEDLARRTNRIDIYANTLDSARDEMVALIDRKIGRMMAAAPSLDRYIPLIGAEVDELHALARPLGGSEVLMVNSTAVGGGVAEMLNRLVPLLAELGLAPRWEVIAGDREFYEVTKAFHNALHGALYDAPPDAIEIFRRYSEVNRARLRLDAEFAVMHDPQPVALIDGRSGHSGHWIWRCHIDLSRPSQTVWEFLEPWVNRYDAAIFSSPDFSRQLPIPQYLFYPSIDPLSDKNRPLEPEFVRLVLERYGIDPARPILVQISRFDRLKDPVGVVRAYRAVKRYVDCQLVLAGGGADDDPEGSVVLAETREAAAGDPDIHILELAPDQPSGDQRAADGRHGRHSKEPARRFRPHGRRGPLEEEARGSLGCRRHPRAGHP